MLYMSSSFYTKESLEAAAKMKHIKSVADITEADRLEPFILDDERIVICSSAASGQIACDATQEGFMVCPTGMPQAPVPCPAPKKWCTTAYSASADEEEIPIEEIPD
jgi:hypothetical protein